VYKYDIDKIEGVQRRYLERLSGFHCLLYESRLVKLSLDSLYCRRVKSDLVMCYKIDDSSIHRHACRKLDE